MYRIAVCEDNKILLSQLSLLLSEILDAQERLSYEIESFSDTSALLSRLSDSPNAFNLLCLDIEMPPDNISGIDLAHRLRELRNHVSIIFLTGADEYLKEGYSVQPVHFLLKPITKKALSEAVCTDLQNNYFPKCLSVEIGKRTIVLDLERILYIECLNHMVYIHTDKEETLSFSLPLSRLIALLPSRFFCRCHKSFLVNMLWITDMQASKIILRNGKTLSIGRNYQKEVQKHFIHYLNHS